MYLGFLILFLDGLLKSVLNNSLCENKIPEKFHAM